MKSKTLTFKNARDFKKFIYQISLMPTMFNRPIKESHVKSMADSIKKIGVQRAITVIRTSAFGEGDKNYFGDGQHLAAAILTIASKNLKGHFVIIINEISAIDKIIPFVSKMNSTASNWSMRDYLNSWVTHGLVDYKFLLDVHEKTGHGISPLVEIYLNRRANGNYTFKQGKFKANKSKGDRVLKLYDAAVDMGFYKSNSSFLAFTRFVVDHSKLDEGFMLNRIQKDNVIFGAKFSREGYLSLLRARCKKII